MILFGQILAIVNDVYLRQSDPSDIVGLVVLVALGILVLRCVGWARWTVVIFVGIGGVVELAGVVLLIAARSAPGFWPALESAVPALASLHAAVVAFTTSAAFPVLVGSTFISAVLDLVAAGILVWAPSVRADFASGARPSA
jgi:hypothetical protein